MALLGTFPDVGYNALVAPNSGDGRIYFLTSGDSGYSGGVTTWSLRAYEQETFRLVGTLAIPGVSGTPTSLVRWGANGLAFRTSSRQLFLIQTSLTPSSEPIPDPTPTPTATPSPTPVELSVRALSLAAKDIVYDSNMQRLYASVSSAAGSNGNSITPVDPATGTLGASVFIGSEPGKLALLDDNRYLYAALEGAGAVRRFDVMTQTPDLQFSLGIDNYYGQRQVTDLAVLPGKAESVAVSRSQGGIAVYDNGVQRPKTDAGYTGHSSSSLLIETSASATRLYGLSNGIVKINVDATGVSSEGITPSVNGGGDFKFDQGLIFTANGQVVNPETGELLGTNTFPTMGYGDAGRAGHGEQSRLLFNGEQRLQLIKFRPTCLHRQHLPARRLGLNSRNLRHGEQSHQVGRKWFSVPHKQQTTRAASDLTRAILRVRSITVRISYSRTKPNPASDAATG
jgi:hypothetical protein